MSSIPPRKAEIGISQNIDTRMGLGCFGTEETVGDGILAMAGREGACDFPLLL